MVVSSVFGGFKDCFWFVDRPGGHARADEGDEAVQSVYFDDPGHVRYDVDFGDVHRVEFDVRVQFSDVSRLVGFILGARGALFLKIRATPLFYFNFILYM